MKNILIIILLSIANINLYSKYFNKFNTVDGLSHPTVLSISKDSLGRLWFGTVNGLSIYDGIKFLSYRPYQKINDKVIFKGGKIHDIVSDRYGYIYIRTSKELLKYDIFHDKFQTVYDGIVSDLCSFKGIIYFSENNELFKLNQDDKPVLIASFRNIIKEFMIDSKGYVWFLGNNEVFLSKNWQTETVVMSYASSCICETSVGDIWIGTKRNGIVRILKSGEKIYYNKKLSEDSGFYSDFVRDITEDSNGNIWIGTFDGLYKYNSKLDDFLYFTKDENKSSLSNNSIYSLYFDDNGYMWIGTYASGVNYTNTDNDLFTYIPSTHNQTTLSSPIVGDMTEDNEGNIWICTSGGGLNMFNPINNKVTRLNTDILNSSFISNLKTIYFNKDKNTLYIGSHGEGLISYDLFSKEFKQESRGILPLDPMNIITKITPIDENLYLSTPKSIFRYNVKNGINSFFIDLNSSDFSTCVSNTNNGNLVYSYKDSIYLYDVKNRLVKERYGLNNYGLHNGVVRVYQSGDGSLFLCTSGNGVMKLNKKESKFENFPKSYMSNLSDFSYRIVETNDGKLISTGNKGVSVFSKNGELIRFFKLGKMIPLSSITSDCGLYVSKNGKIYIGGTNGLAFFNESDIVSDKRNDKLYFSDLYLNGRRIESSLLPISLPFAKRIDLPYNHNRIEFYFSSKENILNMDNSIYEYRLSGFEKNWIQTDWKAITYTNLPVGNYTLELRVKTDGSGRKDICGLGITVLPPWYFTWWAFLIYLFVVVIIAFLVGRTILNRRKVKEMIRLERMEKEKIKEINEAKLRFFTSVSHEFRTPLTLITGNIQQILQSHYLPPLLYNKIMKVMRQSEQLNELITELIEFRKYEQNLVELNVSPCNLNVFLEEIYQSFNIIAIQNKVSFVYERCPDDVCIYFDKKQIKKVLYNLLSNAFKYTSENGEIHLKAYIMVNEGFVNISVSDSGVGIPEKDLPYVFVRFYRADNEMTQVTNVPGAGIGLALAKDIVELHGGQISVSSKVGEGTSFTVSLRTGKDFFIGKQNIILNEEGDNSSTVIVTEEISFGNVYVKDTDIQDVGTDDKILDDKEKPLILIVDDNKEILDILWNIFSPFYQVIMAENGQMGYEKVKEQKPDIVVSDVMMPVMNGYELCTKIKGNMDYCHIPVVLLTALNMQEHNLEGLLHGADDYIGKPFSAQLLLAKCNNLIRARRLIYQQLTKQVNDDVSLLATNNLDKDFLEKVQSIIEKRFFEDGFTVDSLASDMYMGRTSFYNKFKDLTGITPSEYVNTYRLKLASVWLLNNDDKSIADIAMQLGFGSYNYFCRKFKECFSVSPTQYRKEHL